MVKSYVEEVVMLLGTAPEKCYLTGSRVFRPNPHPNLNRDYDFFVKDTQRMRDWLEDHEFSLLSEGPYVDDPQFTVVYRHILGVDVQLTKDPDRKLAIQNIIKNNRLFVDAGTFDKRFQKSVWRALFEATQI